MIHNHLISKVFHHFRQNWPVWFGLSCWLILTITNPFSAHHQLKNLEPYPDGLYYTITGQNFFHGQGLDLVYRQASFRPKIPPAYSLLVGLFIGLPAPFYWVNFLLGIVTVILLYRTLQRFTKRQSIQLASLVLFVFHTHLAWFVTLPMAENLGLLLITVLLFLLSLSKWSTWRVGLLVSTLALLIFTKYVYAPISGLVGMWLIWKLVDKRSWPELLVLITTGLLWLGAFFAFLTYISFNPFAVVKSDVVLDAQQLHFFVYSASTIGQNLIFYLKTLLGQAHWVLWQRFPLTLLGLFSVAELGILGVVSSVKALRSLPFWLLGLAGAPAIMLLFFYTQDARYLLTAIPCLVLFFAALSNDLVTILIKRLNQPQLAKQLLWLGLALCVILQIFSQRSFIKQLLVTNLLFRSQAWQYRAVQHFLTTPELTPDSYLVTALPPFFIQYYDLHMRLPSVLPLSGTQEFASKGVQAWAEPLDFKDLPSHYQNLLKAGKKLFISNAYVTQTAAVTKEYEQLQQRFHFTKINDGCEQTCNVYQLELE